MRHLSLADWSAVSQVVGAGAVVISIVYLALEVRSNTKAVEAATLLEVNRIAREQILLVAANADLNRLDMVVDLGELTPEESNRWKWLTRSFWLGMQTVFRQWELGVLPDDEWAVYHAVICNNIGSPAVRSRWADQRPPRLIPRFARLVEACPTFDRAQ